jgi:hypothetical protein
MTGVHRSSCLPIAPNLRNFTIATIAIAAIVGCASVTPPSRPAVPATSVGAPSGSLAQAQQLTDALAQRGRWMNSLQTPAIMEYTGGDGQHLKTRETILVRRPASLRVEALSPMGVAAVVTANDSQIAVFEASNNTLKTGSATAQTLNRFVQIPAAPRDAVNLLMGLAPEEQALTGKIDSVWIEGDLTIVSYAKDDGSRTELGFAGNDLALARQKMANRALAYEVHYRDYREIGGTNFPYELDARFPIAGTRVKFNYQRPIVNAAVEDTAFVLVPGDHTKELSLDEPQLSLLALKKAGRIED